MIEMVSDETFEQEVIKAGKPVLVEFSAGWCGPCKALAPILKDIEAGYSKKLKVVQVDVDESYRLVQDYRIRAYPTLLLMKDGKIIDQVAGSPERKELEELLKKNRISKNK